jgi:hypothetical protein
MISDERKAYIKAWKEKNRLKTREHYRKWFLAKYSDYYTKNSKKINKRNNLWIKNNEPEKSHCRYQTRWAVTSGKIKKLPCKVCGEKKVQAHHEDYSKPLEVIWLCSLHHAIVHGKKLCRMTLKEGD